MSNVPTGVFGRMPTGAKLFVILSIALLPLAVIGMVATLQMTRVADQEARARLRVASDEAARAIGNELVGDMTALRVALNALGSDPADATSCARAQGIFAQQSATGTRFEIVDRTGHTLCGRPIAVQVAAGDNLPISATIVPGQGLVLAISGPADTSARAYFPVRFLSRLGTPSTRATLFDTALFLDDTSLDLSRGVDTARLDRMETQVTPLGIGDLALHTSTRSAPITSSFIVALLLPLLMWAAAASIGWFVVDQLLIRPLRRLRTSVASYVPGQVIETGGWRTLPAQEIRDLGDTFRAISRTVALHEAGLADGLVRQTKLTREVHHRVKNNLQVISSLINFHARAAPSADAQTAYGAIQRRVDALAVVHRNHYAADEESRGLNLRAIIGELAANIRSTAHPTGKAASIVVDMEPLLVNQDVAVAVAFLVTEAVELALAADDAVGPVRVTLRAGAEPGRALLRVAARSLVESDRLRELVATRYGRVMEGLSRQLRAPLHHDPLLGQYEIAIAVTGRD